MAKKARIITNDNYHAIVSLCFNVDMTRNQINDTFLFQNRVKVKVVGEVSEK